VAKYRVVKDGLSRNRQTVKRASAALERKIEGSAAFPAFTARSRSAFYFYWGALWLEYGEPDIALARFRQALQINPNNIYARAAYGLTKVMGGKAVVFYRLKRSLLGLRKLPGV
jgi:tetratricopeptide (TPR) repeat protein